MFRGPASLRVAKEGGEGGEEEEEKEKEVEDGAEEGK
jgi:hypothetical protein